MTRTGLKSALALLLAVQASAIADSRAAQLCGADHVDECSDDVPPNNGDDCVGPRTSMDHRPAFSLAAVTVHLTDQGKLVRLPRAKPMASMTECRAWTRQQSFMRVPNGYLAAFHYCDCALQR